MILQYETEAPVYIQWYEEDGYIYCAKDPEVKRVELYVNGQDISPILYKLEEGINTIHYIVFDMDENILVESDKTFIRDTTAPSISFYVKNHEIDDVIYVEDDAFIDVSIDDLSKVWTRVYVDDEEVEFIDNKIHISKENSKVSITCTDDFQNTITKEIQIEKIVPIEISTSIENDSYTTSENVSFDTKMKDVEILVYQKEQEIVRFALDEISSYTFKEKGEYQFKTQYKDIPYLSWNLLHVFFTNEKPNISIDVSTLVSNQDLQANIQYSGDSIKNVTVKVNDQIVDPNQSILLSAKENEDRVYIIEAYIEDMYHQISTDKKTVHIDTIIPTGSFQYGNTTIDGNSISFIDLLPTSFVKNKDMVIDMKFIYEGKEYTGISLDEMLRKMKENSSMESIYYLMDEAGNTNTVSMIWNKLKKVLETTDVSTIQNPIGKDEVIYQRIWQEDKDNNLVLEKVETSIQDMTAPKIRILQNNQLDIGKWKKNDICRITIFQNMDYSNDRFVSLFINGKEVNDFKIDELGNMYYEFKVNGYSYDIEAKAIDDSKNESEFSYSIKRKPPYYLFILPFILILGWFYREKNSRFRP